MLHGLIEAQQTVGLGEIALFDIDRERVEIIAALCREIARSFGSSVSIRTPESLEKAVEGAEFIIHSIRAGGIATRARDERLAIELGIAGQETTGLAGFAKALRTIPIVLEQAQIIERVAPDAWFISFTNPAGLMTQALKQHTRMRVIGICDTPTEMFHRIALALDARPEDLRCNYFGLNHLGWIDRVMLRGKDVTERLLGDDAALRSLYHADLFAPEMIRSLRLIPSEYLFFYYGQSRALANQRRAGASRGEEIERLNEMLFDRLHQAIAAGRKEDAIAIYREYLQRRSGSYMKLEAEAGSALHEGGEQSEDPFHAVTGYHRIAIDVITALVSDSPARIVLNVSNQGAIDDLEADDVVEVPCLIDRNGPIPTTIGPLPRQVRGLTQAVKEYERLTIQAAAEKSFDRARLALSVYPVVGEWEIADRLLTALTKTNDPGLQYLTAG